MGDNNGYVLEMTISAAVWAESDTKNDEEKKTKEKQNKELKEATMSRMKQYTCALLNSDRLEGKLVLKVTDGEIKNPLIKLVRPIEQHFQNALTTRGVNKNLRILNETSNGNEITILVKACSSVCTLDYGLYLPTDTQVLELRPFERENVKELLNENKLVDITEIDKNIPAKFVVNCPIGIRESKTVQFKNLSAVKSKGGNLASRILNNHLTHYISAFANNCGGRFYCGITDEGIVVGVKITEKDKKDIEKKVTKQINKMKWPEYCGEPQQGAQWDITFEEVLDNEDNSIEKTFVIVIKVNACPGGVFCKDPESYHIVKGEVKKMKFDEWKERLLYSDRRKRISLSMPLCDWSSQKRRDTCDKLDGQLLGLINNGEWEIFKGAVSKYHPRDAEEKMVVLSKLLVYHYRKSNYDEAEKCYKEYENFLSSIDNVLIFEIRGKLVLSALERTRGNYKESYEIAKDCLWKVEQLPPCILTAEFYVHFATMLTIIEANKELKSELQNGLTKASFKDEAIAFYDKAIQHLRKTDYVPLSKADMEKKVYINLALLKLGCSLSGDVIDDVVSIEAIKAASTNLKRVNDSLIDDYSSLSGFRECQKYFALSSLFYRRSQHEISEQNRIQHLKAAVRNVMQAEVLAKHYNFNELSSYAGTHAKVFKEKLQQQEQSQTWYANLS